MAKFPNLILTTDGLDMLAKAGSGQEEDKLIITKARLGDGSFSGNVRELKNVVSPKLDALLASIVNEGNGKMQATFTYTNSEVETGFYHREIGILAKNGTTGQEKLLSYANAGNYSSYLPDKTEPIPLQTMILGIAIGDLENVSGEVNLSNAITEGRLKEELEKYLPLSGGTMAGLLSLFTGSTITTPEATDNSKKIVNSEWVQALIKNIISELSENLEVQWSGSTFTVPALGITGLMAQNGYISLGKLFGGLILQWGMCVSSVSGTAIQNFLISYPKYCLFMLPYSDEIVGLDVESIKNVTPIDTNRFYCVSRNPQTGQYNQNQFGYVAFGI